MGRVLPSQLCRDALRVALTACVSKFNLVHWLEDAQFCDKTSHIFDQNSLNHGEDAAVHGLNTLQVCHTFDVDLEQGPAVVRGRPD